MNKGNVGNCLILENISDDLPFKPYFLSMCRHQVISFKNVPFAVSFFVIFINS